jgi:peptidyl-prolyl cis-trans isomerase D
MISWMQRHRKYLVVTIWISTIAFVGAGFVGWGAYSFNDSSNAVAKVGEEKITVKDFQREYSNMFGMYQQIMGGNFDEAKAKELNLQDQVLKTLINRAYMTNLAHEFGLAVTDEEVAKEIAKVPSFFKDGIFDNATYKLVLKNNRMKASDFEELLRKDLLVKKLYKAISPQINNAEKESILSALYIKDLLKVSVVDSKDLKLVYNDDDLKKFWEKNRDNYLTKEMIELEIYKTELSKDELSDNDIKKFYEENKTLFTDSDGKILEYAVAKNDVEKELRFKNTKKYANKNFYKFKNKELEPTETIKSALSDLDYDMKSMEKVIAANSGDVLKPIKVEDGYIVARVVKKIKPAPKSFEDAKAEMIPDFESEAKVTLLENSAKDKLKNFDGKRIGYISRKSTTKIDGLTAEERNIFINKLFSKNSKKDYIIVGNRAVVYEIVAQKLPKVDNSDDMFNENIINIKESLLDKNMIKMLSDKYQVEKYLK